MLYSRNLEDRFVGYFIYMALLIATLIAWAVVAIQANPSDDE